MPARGWCTASCGASRAPEALDFWARRLTAEGVDGVARDGDSLRFGDPEGLDHELVVTTSPDTPLTAEHPEIPAEHALQGFEGVRAYSAHEEGSRSCSSAS